MFRYRFLDDLMSLDHDYQKILQVISENEYNDQALTPEELDSLAATLKRLAGMVTKDQFNLALQQAELISDTSKKEDEEKVLLEQIVELEKMIGDLRDRLEANRKEYSDLLMTASLK